MRRLLLFFIILPGYLLLSAQVPTSFSGDLLSESRFAAGLSPASIATGDLNGDGKLDAVVANASDGTIGVSLGNGDGTLGSPSFLPLPPGSFPSAVALADLDGDGNLDIIEADDNSSDLSLGGVIRVLLGKGDGTFQSPVSYVAGKNLTSLVVADFNGDGKPDVATVDNTSHSVSVLLNDGTGKLEAPVPYATSVGSHDIASADLRKNGKLDLIVSNGCGAVTNPLACESGDSSISVLLGNGDGTFQSPVSYATDSRPLRIAVSDFNGDGFPDVALTTSNVSVLLGNGEGTFSPFVTYTVNTLNAPPDGITSGDFNADSKVDLLVTAGNKAGATELLGNGDGTFQSGINYFIGSSFSFAFAADMNRDGHLDLMASASANTISTFLNAFGKTRQPTTITVSAVPNPGFPTTPILVTATVSADGGTTPTGSVTFYVNGQMVLSPPGPQPIGIVDSTGHAAVTVTPPGVGSYSIAAIYSGNTLMEGSISSEVVEKIIPSSTATGLISSINPSSIGQMVTFTADVSCQCSFPLANVSFFDGATLLGTQSCAISFNGHCQVAQSISNLTAGLHSITATYSGNSVTAPSTSPVFTQNVGGAPLTISAGSASSVTINAGQTATYNLTLVSSGFDGTANLGCSGLPQSSTCTANPATVTLTNGATAPFTLRINTQARGAGSGQFLRVRRDGWLVSVPALGLLLMGALIHVAAKTTRRRRLAIIFVGLSLALCLGCGGGSGPSGSHGTPPGAYTIVVNATSSATTATQNLTLIVN